MKLQRILSNSGTGTTVLDQTSYKPVSNGVLNSRKTGVVSGKPPKGAASSLPVWRPTSVPFALLPLIFVLLVTGCVSQAMAADITAIPTPSYASTSVNGINDLGQVVGGVVGPSHNYPCRRPEDPPYVICLDSVETAYIYSHGRVTYEGTGCYSFDSGCFGRAFSAINNSGQSVATASGQFYFHGEGTATAAFLFSGGRWIRVPSIAEPGGFADYNEASAINASGMVVGASDYTGTPFEGQHAFLYSGGQTIDLGDLSGDYYGQSSANAINDRGQVVGVSDTASGAQHAFLYSNGKMSDLGSLGANSSASGINNAGEIVGTSGGFAFLYVNGRMIDIGHGAAQAINQAGEVVGTSDGFAFLYVNGRMIDLNSLLPENSGWQLWDATAINNYGVIVGDGTYNGQPRSFVLYTTPEPVPPALLGIGIVCLGLICKRSNQHST